MNKPMEKGLVPELRFPEFQGQSEWETNPLSTFLKSLDAGVSVNSGDRPAKPNEVGILKTSAVTDGIFDSAENKVVFDDKEINRLKEPVRENTIIISRMNTPVLVGANAYINSNFKNLYLPDRLWAAKPKPNTEMRFIASILCSDKGRKALSELAKGTSGSMKNITKADVLDLQILAPSLREQQKIADCISSLDELMNAHTQKLDALKAHKTGLMQQLFPAEGETVPKLRFPEFINMEQWETKYLLHTCNLQAGKFVKASEIKERWENSSFPCYGGNGLRGFTKTFTHEGEYSLIGRQGALCGNITFVCKKFHATEHAVVVTPKDNVNKYWLYYELVRLDLNRFATGQAQPGLSVDNLLKVKTIVPKEAEQQKIADCLSSLDELITAQNQKIDVLKTHKKGLMQQLFPSVDGVHMDKKSEVGA